jgi:hypothetical protein
MKRLAKKLSDQHRELSPVRFEAADSLLGAYACTCVCSCRGGSDVQFNDNVGPGDNNKAKNNH